MANVTTGNPYIIDTLTSTAITSDGFFLYALVWSSGSTADAISIQDEDGVVKYESTGSQANHSERMTWPNDYPVLFNGLKVPTLGSGKVYLYVKPSGKR